MAKLEKQQYAEICNAIKQVGGNAPSTDETVLFVADTISTVFDTATHGILSTANTAAQTLYNIVKAGSEGRPTVVPNPWFVVNGHEDIDSIRSARYVESRAWKSIGASAWSLGGTAASSHTLGINFADVVTHGNAVGSTAGHLIKLVAIASHYRNTKSITIQDWLKLVLTMKVAKGTIRTGQLIGGVVPGASMPVGIATAVAKLGIRLTLNTTCLTTAAAIHWRAYQEQKLSGSLFKQTGRKIGPASRIFWEIFTRRGLTAAFGKYDIDALIGEPGGWLALHDKLMLI